MKAGLDFRDAVKLPQDEDLNDWLAVHGKRSMASLVLLYSEVAEVSMRSSR